MKNLAELKTAWEENRDLLSGRAFIALPGEEPFFLEDTDLDQIIELLSKD